MVMECANCHTEITPGAEYCGNCGAKITNSDSSPVVTSPVAAATVAPAMPVENTPPANPSASEATPGTSSTTSPSPLPSPQSGIDTSSVAPVVVPGSAVPPANAGVSSSGAVNTTTAIPKQPSSGLSIAGMVLGILSILSFLLFFVSIPLGILAIIFGIIGIAMKRGRGMAIAGLITGILGITLSVLIIVFAVNVATQCEKDPYKTGCEKYNKSSSYSQSIFNSMPDLPFNFK